MATQTNAKDAGALSSHDGTPPWHFFGQDVSYLPPTMAGSTAASALGRFPTHPIDTCKAKLQVQVKLRGATSSNSSGASTAQAHNSQPSTHSKAVASRPFSLQSVLRGNLSAAPSPHTTPYRGLFDVLRRVYLREGVLGLYQGFGIALLGSAPAGMLYWTSYETSKIVLSHSSQTLNNHESLTHFTAGLVAEAFACLLFVPIDVIKERLQVQSSISNLPDEMRYRGNLHAVSSVMQQEGIRGIYRGYGATVASFGPFSAFYLMFYERFKRGFAEYLEADPARLPTRVHVASGLAAGSLAAFVTNPLDLAKLRLQVQRRNIGFTFGYRNLAHGLVQVVRQEGASALFKGVTARVAQAGPTGAINVALYEYFKHFFFDYFEVPL